MRTAEDLGKSHGRPLRKKKNKIREDSNHLASAKKLQCSGDTITPDWKVCGLLMYDLAVEKQKRVNNIQDDEIKFH